MSSNLNESSGKRARRSLVARPDDESRPRASGKKTKLTTGDSDGSAEQARSEHRPGALAGPSSAPASFSASRLVAAAKEFFGNFNITDTRMKSDLLAATGKERPSDPVDAWKRLSAEARGRFSTDPDAVEFLLSMQEKLEMEGEPDYMTGAESATRGLLERFVAAPPHRQKAHLRSIKKLLPAERAGELTLDGFVDPVDPRVVEAILDTVVADLEAAVPTLSSYLADFDQGGLLRRRCLGNAVEIFSDE